MCSSASAAARLDAKRSESLLEILHAVAPDVRQVQCRRIDSREFRKESCEFVLAGKTEQFRHQQRNAAGRERMKAPATIGRQPRQPGRRRIECHPELRERRLRPTRVNPG
jgi:hypothetical protein